MFNFKQCEARACQASPWGLCWATLSSGCTLSGFLLTSFLAFSGCANFDQLETDLSVLDENRVQFFGRVTDSSESGQPVVIVNMSSADGSDVINYRVLSLPGEFEIWLERGSSWFFAYTDSNRDFVFQISEPYGWYNEGLPVNTTDQAGTVIEIPIEKANSGQVPPPPELIDHQIENFTKLQDIKIGEVASTAEERFSEEAAEKGLWQPFASVLDGAMGLFFLEPYDNQRIPVVLVHGIGGSPRAFATLIESIDLTRFQIWFLNYPTGFRLETLGNSMFQILEILEHRYGFHEAHIIAHSMGGLVSRKYVNDCIELDGCRYLKTFTTIASPYGGVKSAGMGVEYAPTVVPVWNDLRPGSVFLSDLFNVKLPQSMANYLLFAYRGNNIISLENSDGVIALSSQLRREAQEQATNILGFDQTHVAVLEDSELLVIINRILNGHNAADH